MQQTGIAIDTDDGAARRGIGRAWERKGRANSSPSETASRKNGLEVPGPQPPADPKANRIQLIVWMIAVSRRGAQVNWTEVPGAATHNTQQAIGLGARFAICWQVLVILKPAVLDPLADVAVHIVETERIRPKRSNRRRLLIVPRAAAAIAVCSSNADLIAPGEVRLALCARGIFPLGLRQETIFVPCLPR